MGYITRARARQVSPAIALGAMLVISLAGGALASTDASVAENNMTDAVREWRAARQAAAVAVAENNMTDAVRQSRLAGQAAEIVAVEVAGSVRTPAAALESGELPAASFVYTSLADELATGSPDHESLADVYAWLANTDPVERTTLDIVDANLSVSEPIVVETTYTLEPADPGYRRGWQHSNGPVVFTVTSGTLTLIDDTCQTFDLGAGQSYIESAGGVIDAVLLPEKNPGVSAVGWFTTRLSPTGAADPILVEAPCVR